LGRITDTIRRAESLEELEKIRQAVLYLVRMKRISMRSLRTINQAGKAKAEELGTRIIETPGGKRTPGGLYLP
jgi:hypothetical protein